LRRSLRLFRVDIRKGSRALNRRYRTLVSAKQARSYSLACVVVRGLRNRHGSS